MRATGFTTDRLLLRPFTIDDLPLMQTLDRDIEVVRYLGSGKLRSEEESEANLAKILRDYQKYGLGLFAVIEKSSGEFIGRSGLIPWVLEGRLVWETGYSFARQSWGKGYATEVARMLAGWAQTNRLNPSVISLIHRENSASIHVAEKIGMSRSGQVQLGQFHLSVYQLNFEAQLSESSL